MFRHLILFAFLASMCLSQQPNTPGTATATWAGVNGPTGPLTATPTALSVSYTVTAAPFSPYSLVMAPAGTLPTGSATPIGLFDLNPAQGFYVPLDGFAPQSVFDYYASTSVLGTSTWSIPIGQNTNFGAFQTVVRDLTSPPFNLRLTAATNVSVTYGINWTVTPTNSTYWFTNLAFGAVHFYGTSYSQVFAFDDGRLEFGLNPVSGVSLNNPNSPKVYILGTDLAGGFFNSQNGTLEFTETPVGLTVAYKNMHAWNGFYVAGTSNSFSAHYDYPTAIWTLSYPAGMQSATSATIGITPGQAAASGSTGPAGGNWLPYSSCGSSVLGPFAPFVEIGANNGPVPSGCSLTFTPTGFSLANHNANGYRVH